MKRTNKRGMRGRLMVALSGFAVIMIALAWLFQIVLLDAFYEGIRIRVLHADANAILSRLASEDLNDAVKSIARHDEMNILIVDEWLRTVASAQGQTVSIIHHVGDQVIREMTRTAPQDGTARVIPVEPPDSTADFPQGEERWQRHGKMLLYVQRAQMNGMPVVLLINLLISPVDATVSVLRSQLGFITLLMLLIAAAISGKLSKTLSEPITQTNTAAKELARARYDRTKIRENYREIAELNDTLEQAAKELGQVERLQKELIANISHDLRTPLTMIGGYAEMMRDLPGESTPENLQIIMDETKRLTSLVNDLLDFSRIQSGQSEMQKMEISLTDLTRSVLSRCAAMTASQGFRLQLEADRDVTVLCDPQRMEQVIYNLLNNAMTYAGEDRTVRVAQTMRGTSVRVEVQNSGDRIPPQELERIWERYYRSSESHRRAVQGSGLGLSIVRSVLEAHGMRYGVTSDEKLTVFWFEADGKASDAVAMED